MNTYKHHCFNVIKIAKVYFNCATVFGVLIQLSCGPKSDNFKITLEAECSKPPDEYYCDSSNQLQPITPGTCEPSGDDCPPPYNGCSNGKCVSTEPSNSFWFATDPIRPGVTVLCNGVNCQSKTDYVYNVMAKGYSSLDDWCASQAQQSSYKKIRDMKSWTAILIAQPDNGQTFSSTSPEAEIISRLKLFNDVKISSSNLYAKSSDQRPQPDQNTEFWFGLVLPKADTLNCIYEWANYNQTQGCFYETKEEPSGSCMQWDNFGCPSSTDQDVSNKTGNNWSEVQVAGSAHIIYFGQYQGYLFPKNIEGGSADTTFQKRILCVNHPTKFHP